VHANGINIIENQRTNVVLLGPEGAGKNTLIKGLLLNRNF